MPADPMLVRIAPEIVELLESKRVDAVVLLGVERQDDGTYELVLGTVAGRADAEVTATRIAIAEQVIDHWVTGIMSHGDLQVDWRAAAHPLALVRDALGGEVDPEQLGIDPSISDHHDQIRALAAGAPEMPTFSDLGDSLVRFQGGVIILRGFGCGRCGNGHWAEDDAARRRPVGTAVACPHCGKPSVLPEVPDAA